MGALPPVRWLALVARACIATLLPEPTCRRRRATVICFLTPSPPAPLRICTKTSRPRRNTSRS
ncbi:hypothetical protein J3E68DRAFT_416533 [Trichoderma sp. SZMC 28012]